MQNDMDPWGDCQESVTTYLDCKITLKFEDNFLPTARDILPDSEQYLATLEARLKRLKSDPNILKQLAEKREACMQQLLSSNNSTSDREAFNDPVDIPVSSSQLLRTILPHKQALNQGEIVELVKYDQLNNDCPDAESVEENINNHSP